MASRSRLVPQRPSRKKWRTGGGRGGERQKEGFQGQTRAPGTARCQHTTLRSEEHVAGVAGSPGTGPGGLEGGRPQWARGPTESSGDGRQVQGRCPGPHPWLAPGTVPTAVPFRTVTSPTPSACSFQPTLGSYTRPLPCRPLLGGDGPLSGCLPEGHLTNIHESLLAPETPLGPHVHQFT